MKELNGARPAWIEVNLSNLKHNIREIQKKIKKETKIMAVVKADAYGHGAVEISKTLLEYGIEYFAVSTVDEGIKLRKNGVDKFILILGITDEREVNKIVEYDLVASVVDNHFVKALNCCAKENNKKVKVHIRVDVGKCNLGIEPDSVVEFSNKLLKLKNIEVDGIYTHFYSCYGKDDALIKKHINNYSNMLKTLDKNNIHFRLIHAASSPAIINYNNECEYNMVRAGNILYGIAPELDNDYIYDSENFSNYKPVMELKSKIVDIKKIQTGSFWEYGSSVDIKENSILGYIPLGYADGLSLIYLDKMEVLIRGERVKVFGKVFMDSFTVDITNNKDVKIGDEVVIFGQQKHNRITVEEIAYKARVEKNINNKNVILTKTISKAAVCLLSNRLERIFIENNIKSTTCYSEVNK